MSFLPRLDTLHNIPCSDISPERVKSFFASAGMGSTGLFAIIILGPVVVRCLLRWQNRRRREEEQSLSVAIIIPTGEKTEGARTSLIFGENPDYHGEDGLTSTTPLPSGPSPRHARSVRHLRIHSLDELPPPTMDDITPPRSPWSCLASPTSQSGPPREISGRRRSPFNPIIPGMRTTWEEGVDPATGRKWRRKLIVYTGVPGPLEAGASMGGEFGARDNGMPLDS